MGPFLPKKAVASGLGKVTVNSPVETHGGAV